MMRELRFAFATCQDWPSGYYTAYRDMLNNDLDLVLHLGDYTYEYAIGSTTAAAVRRRQGSSAKRSICAPIGCGTRCYKLDPDLQAAHAKFPFAVIWDDHEVAERLLGSGAGMGLAVAGVHGTPRGGLPGLLRAHAHPLASRAEPRHRDCASIGGCSYGRLAEFTMLDDRQYRTDNPCGDGESLRCDGGA